MITYEFAQRIFRQSFLIESPVALWKGELSPDFPLQLAVAPSTEIVGTLSTKDGSYKVVLKDSVLEPMYLCAFYSNQLRASGWKLIDNESKSFPHHLSFLPSNLELSEQKLDSFRFFHPRDNRLLTLDLEQSSRVAKVHIIKIIPEATYRERIYEDELGWVHFMTNEFPAPILFPPSGCTVELVSGGGGGAFYSWNSHLATIRPLSEVTRHYSTQIAQAGWTLYGSSEADNIHTSTWTLRTDTAKHYQLHVNIEPDVTRTSYSMSLHVEPVSSVYQQSPMVETYSGSPRLEGVTANFVNQMLRSPNESESEIQISVGADGLPPLPMSLPPNAQVIGSTRAEEGTSRTFFTVPMTGQQVYDYFYSNLQSAGWEFANYLETPNQARGPLASGHCYIFPLRFFSPAALAQQIDIRSFPIRGGGTEVELAIGARAGDPFPTGEDSEHSQFLADMYGGVIQLLPPANTFVTQNGSSGRFNDTSREFEYLSYAQTLLSMKELFSHYASQILKDGWTEITATDNARVAASVWEKTDSRSRWQMSLWISGIDGQTEHYSIYLRILLVETMP